MSMSTSTTSSGSVGVLDRVAGQLPEPRRRDPFRPRMAALRWHQQRRARDGRARQADQSVRGRGLKPPSHATRHRRHSPALQSNHPSGATRPPGSSGCRCPAPAIPSAASASAATGRERSALTVASQSSAIRASPDAPRSSSAASARPQPSRWTFPADLSAAPAMCIGCRPACAAGRHPMHLRSGYQTCTRAPC